MTVIGNPKDLPEGKSRTGSRVLDLASMDPFSAQIAELIFSKRADWRKLARSDDGTLWVEIPSKVSKLEIAIATFNDEITLFASPGMWHMHFNAEESEMPVEQSVDEALSYADAIMSESLVLEEAQSADGDTSSWDMVAWDEPPVLPDGGKLIRRSWNGKHDSELPERAGWRKWLAWGDK